VDLIKKIAFIFWNPSEHRLRAAIRLTLLLLTFTFAITVMMYANAFLFNIPRFSAFSTFCYLILTIFIVWLGALMLDRRRFYDFGLHLNNRWLKDFSFGMLLGGILIIFIFLFEWVIGWIQISGFFLNHQSIANFNNGFREALIIFINVGLYEEILIRGYILRNLAEGLNFKCSNPTKALLFATVLSSAFFGFLHFDNPNATVLSTFNLTIAGIFLASGILLTGELAISIGLHIAWNFFQGPVFGFSVSGIKPLASIVGIKQSGPQLFTGGAFGPEGGILGLGVMLIGILFILWYSRSENRQFNLKTNLAKYQPGRSHITE
jgi:membrane protease YdiL (CAAX protease family)